jgi:hypothetical protein
MKKKILAVCFLTLVILQISSVTATTLKTTLNKPVIDGPTNGIIGEKYYYKISYNHPQGKDICFDIQWGDCSIHKNVGPIKSGEELELGHTWCEMCCGPGTFAIRVLACDNDGLQSEWGTLDVNMKAKKDHIIFNSIIQQLIQNIINQFNIFT